PTWIVGEASQDPRKLLKELRPIRQPHGNSGILAMLNALAAKLHEGETRFDSREVYFLTDLQQATWTPEALPSPSLLQEIQKRASTVFVDVGRDNVENAAVTMLTLADPLVTTNTSATFQAQVKNFGTQTKEKLNFKLLVGRWP